MVEEHLLQGIQIAGGGIGSQRIVFVEVEHDDVAEAQSLFLVHAYQVGIYVAGRIAACQGQYTEASGLLLVAYQLGDVAGYLVGSFFRSLVDVGGYFLQTGQYGAFEGVLRAVVSGGYPVQRDL